MEGVGEKHPLVLHQPKKPDANRVKIETNVKISVDGEKDKPDLKPKKEPHIKSNREHKQDVTIDLDGEKDKPDVKPKKKPDIK